MTNRMAKFEFESLFQEGERADSLATAGKWNEAITLYRTVALGISRESEGEVAEQAAYIAAKCAVGVLVALCKAGDREGAFAVWNSPTKGSAFGAGIDALEHGRAGTQDLVRYDMACAYLHSISANRPTRLASAVNQYLSRVAEHAVETGDRELLALALSNWKSHLSEIFAGAIPHAAAQEAIRFQRKLGGLAPQRPLDFLGPSPWKLPQIPSKKSARGA